jgi:hypothetical protein
MRRIGIATLSQRALDIHVRLREIDRDLAVYLRGNDVARRLMTPPKRLANHSLAGRVNAVDLKNALGQVEADRGILHSGWLPFCS